MLILRRTVASFGVAPGSGRPRLRVRAPLYVWAIILRQADMTYRIHTHSAGTDGLIVFTSGGRIGLLPELTAQRLYQRSAKKGGYNADYAPRTSPLRNSLGSITLRRSDSCTSQRFVRG